MKRRRYLLPLAIVCAISCTAARADEIRLKDGSKIIGTIVGFEDGSFKVQTAYGFAMVRKTSIQEIVPSDGGKSTEALPAEDSKPADAAAPKPVAKPVPAPQVSSAVKPAAKSPVQPASVAASQAASPAASHPVVAASAPTKPNAKSAATASVSSVPASSGAVTSQAVTPVSITTPAVIAIAPETPKPPSKTAPLRESVLGNLYTNQTYGFSLYRPPDWAIIDDARSAMPEAITALGTDDHSTLLVIGHDAKGGNLDERAADTERKLRDVYENFRPGTSRRISVTGVPAAELRFRGSGDGHDWSVTAVTLIRGNEVFTILGMTSAESDLIQFQEAVISKVIGSLQFVAAP